MEDENEFINALFSLSFVRELGKIENLSSN